MKKTEVFECVCVRIHFEYKGPKTTVLFHKLLIISMFLIQSRSDWIRGRPLHMAQNRRKWVNYRVTVNVTPLF